MRLRGCGTALVTPFTPAGDVDLPALRALVEWQVAEGIDFLVPLGTTGEAQTLTDAERDRVTATVVEVVGGRVPVMAGATSNDTAKAVAETKRLCALGVDAILSATPYYNKPTPAGLRAHFEAVADAATRPVCLYNVPGRAGVNMLPETTLALAAHPNIVAVKEASGDLAQILDVILGAPEGFAVLSGDDWLAPAVILHGGHGLVSVASNEAPGQMTALVAAALAGDVAETQRRFRALLPLCRANFLESNPGPVKAALASMGRIANVLRLPLVSMGERHLPALHAALRAAGIEPKAAAGVRA